MTTYARNVVDGREVTGPFVRQAAERHLRDLKRKDLEWKIDKATRAIEFFPDVLTLEGGVPFALMPFQQFIVGSCFGWYKDGFRRFRTAYVETAKGSGKTPLAAGIGVYGLVADEDEPNAEIYSAASTQDQASISFRDAKRMIEASTDLSAAVEVQVGNLFCPSTGSVFKPVSAEHRGLDGKRVHIGLIDELHEHPTALVVDKIRAGTKARKNALIFEITNSGFDRQSVCWAHHEYSRQVLDRSAENDAWFAFMASLDDGDDWRDPKVWLKTNPGLGTILPMRYLAEQVEEAKGMPSKENIVKRLNFCIWTEQSTRWLPLNVWDACGDPVDPPPGAMCVGGLDLASVSDFSSLCLLFPDGGTYSAIWRFWIPHERYEERVRKGVPLDVWKAAGWLSTTPGSVTDYAYIEREIAELSAKYQIRGIAFDRYNSTDLITRLSDQLGPQMFIDYGQGFLSMSAPSKELERILRNGSFRHGGNPIARWMAGNVSAAQDPAGNIKPAKDKSGDKIDGIVALIMAIGLASKGIEKPFQSVYESRGLQSVGV